MLVNSGQVEARPQDYSTSGQRAVYSGKALPSDTEIYIDLKKLNINGAVKAVWSKRFSQLFNASGFNFR